jgi:hypothetical protein
MTWGWWCTSGVRLGRVDTNLGFFLCVVELGGMGDFAGVFGILLLQSDGTLRCFCGGLCGECGQRDVTFPGVKSRTPFSSLFCVGEDLWKPTSENPDPWHPVLSTPDILVGTDF